MKITVKVFENHEEVLSKVFDEGVYRIGRSDLSDICLDAEGVSRSHVEIRVTENAVYMTNMSVNSKVKVNGKNLETAELKDGDSLAIGNYKVTILLSVEEAAAAPAPTPNFNTGMFEQAGGSGENIAPKADSENPSEPPPVPDSPSPSQGGQVLDFEPGLQPGVHAEGTSRINSPQSEGTAALNRSDTVVELKPVVAKLVFTDGPKAGDELFLEAYEISFGRSKRADIFIDDEKLSRIHAKITRVGMGYRLIDLNSRNGTYVNGVRILEHPLSSFDSIEFGSSKIKFLIHDVVSSDVGNKSLALADNSNASKVGNPSKVMEATRSLQYDPVDPIQLDYQKGQGRQEPQFNAPPQSGFKAPLPKLVSLRRMGVLLLILTLAAYFLIPGEKKNTGPETTVTQTNRPPINDVRIPPVMSKEFRELNPETQRAIEGYYNNALRYADKEQYDEAVANLKKIREVIPYYKQSNELLEQYSKKLQEKKIVAATEKAKNDEKQELVLLLQEGKEYLAAGDWDRASDAFNSAMLLDPNNQVASRGLKAAYYKVRDIEQLKPEVDPESERVKEVKLLFEQAVAAFTKNSYQEAIVKAQQIQKIKLKGDTRYIHEAQQIIDKARNLQKEEFEPFLLQAKEKFAEGDYNTSLDTCELMLKRDPAYDEAKECVLKAKKQLNRLAKEAYTHGYILESMNRLEEAKQYWNRAKNYVRKGDEYYDKVMKKLEYYQ